jgi:trehalose 6-phosphate synthase/phosphatase
MPILEQYTDSTDGAFIKDKGTSVIWHFGDADPDFGAWQAKELMDHLESALVNDPVDVFPGNGHVEIKPQGVSKGTLVEMLLGPESATHLRATGGDKVDFVFAVGDDRSDEEMFHAVADRVANPSSVAKTLLRADSCPMPGHEQKHDHLAVYLSTVGQKPSKADFYLDDTDDVLELLGNLTAAAP